MATRPSGSEEESIGIAADILRLRLLIARAANKDSLAWWDDDSLTAHANYLLERLFPMAPALAARNLALHAALARHEAAFASIGGAMHLFRLALDNRDSLALREVPLLSIPVPVEPIASIEALRLLLQGFPGGPPNYRVVRRTEAQGLQIATLPTPDGVPPALHRAKSLAWAYLEGAPAAPLFPFCME